MIASRVQYSDLFFESALPALEKVLNDEMEIHSEFAPAIAEVKSGKGSIFQATQIWGPGLVSEVAENGAFPDMTTQQGYRQTLRYRKYGGRAPVSREAVDDSRFADIIKGHKSLARSIQETRNVQFASILINGTSGTALGPDGVPLFSGSHPTRFGLQSNLAGAGGLASVAADLDYSSLSLGITDFLTLKTPEGHYGRRMPKTLVVTPLFKAMALEITAKGTRPDTTDRATNVLDKLNGGEMPDVLAIPHLSSLSDDWGLFSAPGMNGIVWIDRLAPYYNAWKEPSLEMDIYQGAYRAIWGWIDYIGSWWNQG